MKIQRCLMVAVLLVGAQAGAQALYGTVGAGGGTSRLIQLDPTTGAQIASIGPIGYLVNGMAWDQSTGTMYGTTSTNDSVFPNGLITIDLTTGAGTPIGSGAGQLVNIPACDAAGNLYGWTEDSDDAVAWDKGAGTITVLGDSGLGTLETGLAFSPGGTLYLVNSGDDPGTDATIYSINTGTGMPTLVGTVGPLPFGMAHHGKFNPADGYYYGIDRTPYWDTSGWQIVVINVANQTIVRFMPTVDNLHTLAFVGGQAEPIPTLSRTGLIAMLLLLAGAAILVVRRRF